MDYGNDSVLILVNHDVVIYNFRVELVEQLLADGYEVHISSPYGERIDDLIVLGAVYHETIIDRHGMNPAEEAGILCRYRKLIKKIKPLVILAYTIKPNIYGGIAAREAHIPFIANITGLGICVKNGGVKKWFILQLYKIGLRKARKVFFQNKENQHFMLYHNIVSSPYELLPGSGVNLTVHRFEPYPADSTGLIFTTIGRIMKDKGTDELLEAARVIKRRHPEVKFRMIGFFDDDYKAVVDNAVKEGIIQYIGQKRDIHSYIAESHAIIHPSYHEGMSNVLLEAAAAGRPVIASNVSGCQETFDEGVSGFGFRARSSNELVNNDDHMPDLSFVENASAILGRNLAKGSIVVFESTVYPGVTEDICIPILERESGLKCGKDFKAGYSPERINPGDKIHKLETIKKIVSGMDEETLDIVAKVYELVVDAGVYRADSIKVAEAAKVIENSQRDINIAFMNELSVIFNKMGIDTKSVLEAAGTKWNFLNFYPGLVGGHCIGVDPYYLTYKAEILGYHSQVILSGRRINDDMGRYVAENCVKNLIAADKPVKGAKAAILGFTFKENCPDTRNTKVIDIVRELEEYGIESFIIDPQADEDEAKRLYSVKLSEMSRVNGVDAVILAVAHEKFAGLKKTDIDRLYGEGKKVLLDIKGILNREEYQNAGYSYWRL